MADKDQNREVPDSSDEPELNMLPVPPMHPKYVEAFLTAMLFALGGTFRLKLRHLEKFPENYRSQIFWCEDTQEFIITMPAEEIEKIKNTAGKIKLVLPNKRFVINPTRN